MKTPRPLWTLLTLGALGLAAWINLPLTARLFDRSAARVAALPEAPAFRAGQRVLLLSPHPDDETLCCGGTLQKAQAAGAQVYVAWITAGDGFEFDAALTGHTLDPGPQTMRALGQRRILEARQAASVLGLPARHLFFLGYPDGGLSRLTSADPTTPYTSPRTGTDRVYVKGALSPGAPFTGQALEADLGRVLDLTRPDLVLAPAPQDFHPDHHALSLLANRLMQERGEAGRLRFWVVHGGLEWPVPKGHHPRLPLTLPPRASALPWQRVSLNTQEEQTKLAAINTYRTQTEVMGRFLRAFVRTNELLSPSPQP